MPAVSQMPYTIYTLINYFDIREHLRKYVAVLPAGLMKKPLLLKVTKCFEAKSPPREM